MNSRVKGIWKLIFILSSFLGIAFAVNHVFQINPTGDTIFITRYLFILVLCYLPLNFLTTPFTRTATKTHVPWYDVLLFFLSVIVCAYFVYNGVELSIQAWSYTGGAVSTLMSLLLILLMLEIMRRKGNPAFVIVILVFLVFPLVADKMPRAIAGQSYDFFHLVRQYAMGDSAMLGIPISVFGDLVMGFVLFGLALEVTGAAKFFMNLAGTLLGKARGGPGKVACAASGFFGTMSGDPISNILATGSVVLPTLKKSGYTNTESAALLTCASSGGALAPPIMGVVAFIMAALTGVSYVDVAIAAAIPSALFYFSMIVQMDFIAAKRNLPGMDESEIFRFSAYMKKDWIYIGAFSILIYNLVFLRLENQAAYLATGVLFVSTLIYREKRMKTKDILVYLEKVGHLISYLVVMLMAVGCIIGGFFITGIGPLLAQTVMSIAGDNLYILLLFTAVLSLILGMGMPLTPAYIFLAIMVAPILEKAGLDVISAHLFIIYWGLFSFMTPPVAVGAFTAAAMVDADPIKVGFKSMTFATILYFVPFYFVLNPAMILRGEFTLAGLTIILTTAIAGIIFLAAGLQGYLPFLGTIPAGSLGYSIRLFIFFGGILLAAPFLILTTVGAILIALALIFFILRKRFLKNGGVSGNIVSG